MKKFFISLLLIINSVSYAQEKGFGLGIMLGEPTGFSAKYWLNNNNAVDLGLAYSLFHSQSSVSIHADYVYHAFDVIKSEYKIPIYYGFGGRIRNYSSKTYLGARGVAGIVYLDKKYPFDAFFEIAPVFNLIPETSLHFDLGIGVRYYFR